MTYPSPSGGLETIPVVGRFPKKPTKRPIKRISRKKRSPILKGSPNTSGRSYGTPGPGSAGGWRTA